MLPHAKTSSRNASSAQWWLAADSRGEAEHDAHLALSFRQQVMGFSHERPGNLCRLPLRRRQTRSRNRPLPKIRVTVAQSHLLHYAPALFLAGNVFKKHLLIEFKKPTLTIGRDTENQAKKYAETLTGKLGMPLDILIIGGEVDPKLVEEYTGKRTTFVSYRSVIGLAKTHLAWMLEQLIKE